MRSLVYAEKSHTMAAATSMQIDPHAFQRVRMCIQVGENLLECRP